MFSLGVAARLFATIAFFVGVFIVVVVIFAAALMSFMLIELCMRLLV